MKTTLIVVQNDADHREALALMAKFMATSSPANRARLTAQARLVEAYEKTRWPRRGTNLPDLLTYLMDQHDLTRADLIPLLGTASRVSEVLSGKRELSMPMVKRLRDRFHIPADLLIPANTRAAA
jgi:HTH-type transcriptional regulator/antitoxin HigA